MANPVAQRLIWCGSLVAALAVHVALALPWLGRSPDALAGAGGQQLDVISVTMVNSAILESRETDQTKPLAPAPTHAVDLNEGAATVQPPVTKKEQPKEPQRKKPEEEQRVADAVLEIRPEPEKRAEERDSSAVGGAAARGDTATPRRPPAPPAASAGAVREYARSVSQALSKTKPKGMGAHGTVRIKFTVAATGKLSSLEIAKSSGNNKLDQRAFDAVRRAVFPAPPAGMTVVQLTFEIPYQFR
jgi:protein TonB